MAKLEMSLHRALTLVHMAITQGKTETALGILEDMIMQAKLAEETKQGEANNTTPDMPVQNPIVGDNQ